MSRILNRVQAYRLIPLADHRAYIVDRSSLAITRSMMRRLVQQVRRDSMQCVAHPVSAAP
jgi:hypothetical protein